MTEPRMIDLLREPSRQKEAIKRGGIKVRIYYLIKNSTSNMNLSDSTRQTATGLVLTALAISGGVYSYIHQDLSGIIFSIFALIVIFITVNVINKIIGLYIWTTRNFEDVSKYIQTLFALTGATILPYRALENSPSLDFIKVIILCAIGAVAGSAIAYVFMKFLETLDHYWPIYAIFIGMLVAGVIYG